MPPQGPDERERTRVLSFVSAPALFAAFAFAAGIALSEILFREPAWLWLATCAALLALLACPRARTGLQWTALLCTWAMLGLLLAELQPVTHPSPRGVTDSLDGATHSFSAVITAQNPVRQIPGWNGNSIALQSADMRLTLLDATVASDAIQFTIESAHGEALPELACGETVRGQARFKLPAHYRTPGAWSPSDTLALRGITLTAVATPAEINGIEPGNPSLTCRVSALQHALLTRLQQAAAAHMSEQDFAVLAAALLGEKTLLTPDIRSAFQRTGTYHLLVVSGLSIAVLAGIVYWLLLRARAPRALATALTLLVITGYALLSGFHPPVRRALIMTAIFMVGRLLYRRLDAMNSLGIAAIVLLAAEPHALFDAGFQMTFVAVLSIAGIVGPLLHRGVRPALRATATLWTEPHDPGLPARIAQLRVMLRLWTSALRPLLGRSMAKRAPQWAMYGVLLIVELTCVSMVLELCLAPLMALYFHRFTALSVAANAVTLLWLSMLLPLGFAVLLLSTVWSRAASALALPLAAFLHAAQWTISRLAALRIADIRVPPTRPLALLLIGVTFLAAVWFARRAYAAVAFACTLAIGALAFWAVPLRLPRNAVEITVLDVGQGDSILVLAPTSKGRIRSLLIDSGGPAGPNGNTNAGEMIGENIVSNYLWSRGIRRLDAVALTHAHADHMGGMPAVLRNFRPRELWVGANPPVASYEALLETAGSVGAHVIEMRAGATTRLGEANILALSPDRDYHPAAAPGNEDSLVLAIEYAGHSALLEGDAQKHSEQKMLARGLPHADLLKIGHHGSLSSTTPEFLNAVSPHQAAISSGRYNLYGHPRMPILQRLEDAHIQTWRTDTEGATTFLIESDGVHPQTP